MQGLGTAEVRVERRTQRRQHRPAKFDVVLVGATEAGGVSLVGALAPGVAGSAGDLIKDAARAVGGGGGGKGDIATAGGKNPAGIDEALAIAADRARTLLADATA